MSKNSDFEVSPVKVYKIPSYPKPRRKNFFVKPKIALALSGGIFLLANGCNPLFEEKESCDVVGVTCPEYNIARVCDDNHLEEIIDCSVWCLQNYGSEYTFTGCSQNSAEEPCFCEYDIILGVEAECTPGDLYCSSEKIYICEDLSGYNDYVGYDCNDYCIETFGSYSSSTGQCNMDDSTNPCECYDIVEGEMAWCEEGDLYCMDIDTIAHCEDGIDYTSKDCDDYCKETNGETSVSQGDCNTTNSENPCNCSAPSPK
jgi:hypothetical protein